MPPTDSIKRLNFPAVADCALAAKPSEIEPEVIALYGAASRPAFRWRDRWLA